MTPKLSIHSLMHVPLEGLGCIEQWIADHNYSLTLTKFYEEFRLPDTNEIDWLIVMGGPMGVYEEAIYPWLKEEKEFIQKAIKKGKTVIGICLGSQLIAEVFGAKVYPNKQKEIGWFDVMLSQPAKKHPLFEGFENSFRVFHWHGDTYDLPVGSELLFSSQACVNQAFLYDKKVLGLQFHLEVTSKTLQEMVEKGITELVENETIQPAEEILKQTPFIENNNQIMFRILDFLAKETNPNPSR